MKFNDKHGLPITSKVNLEDDSDFEDDIQAILALKEHAKRIQEEEMALAMQQLFNNNQQREQGLDDMQTIGEGSTTDNSSLLNDLNSIRYAGSEASDTSAVRS